LIHFIQTIRIIIIRLFVLFKLSIELFVLFELFVYLSYLNYQIIELFIIHFI